MSDIAIRRAGPEDIPAMLELMARCLGGSRPGEFFRWKHYQNPFGPSCCLLAESAGSAIGLRIFLHWEWRYRGTTVRAVRAVDTATHPQWRRQGVFSQLTVRALQEMENEGVAFVFNTPNRRSRPGYLKLGWQTVGRVPLLVRPIRPAGALWRSLAGSRARSEPAGSASFPPVSELLNQVEEEFLSEKRLEVDTAQPRLRTARTRSYLHWRYEAVPTLDYRALWSSHGNSRATLIFHGRTRNRLQEVKICEILMAGDGAAWRQAADLLRVLARSVDADYLVAAAAPGTPEREALRHAGFLPASTFGPLLTVRVLEAREDLPDPLSPVSWSLSVGDLEVF